MIQLLRAFVLAVFLVPVIAAGKPAGAGIDANIGQFLTATRFAPSFKWGVESVIKSQGQSNDVMDRLLALPDEAIVAAVTPLFREQLSEEEAQQLAVFYLSPTGLAITRQQAEHLGQATPSLDLTAAQRIDYLRFMASAGGRATGRLNAWQQTDAYFQRLNAAIMAAINGAH